MTSSGSAGYTPDEALAEAVQQEELHRAVSDDETNSSDASDGAESTAEEEEDKKSRDSDPNDPTKDRDNDDEEGDPDASSSTTTTKPKEKLLTEEFLTMLEGLTIEEKTKLSKQLIYENQVTYEKAVFLKKQLKQHEKEQQKEEKKLTAERKKAEKKEEEKREREKLVSLTITCGGDIKSIIIHITGEKTLKDLKEMICDKIGLKKSKAKKMILRKGEKVYDTEDNRKTVGKHFEDGISVELIVQGKGGGVRKGALKMSKDNKLLITKAQAQMCYSTVKPFTLDTTLTGKADTLYKELLETENTDIIKTHLESLSLEELNELVAFSSSFLLQPSSLYRLTPYIFDVAKQVNDAMTNLNNAKKTLDCAFEHSFTITYFDEGTGQFSWSEFQKHIETLILKKQIEREMMNRPQQMDTK